MGCASSVSACATNTTSQIVSVLTAVANIAAIVVTAGGASGALEAEKAAQAGANGAQAAAKGASSAAKTATTSTEDLVKLVNDGKFADAFKNQGPLTKEFVGEALKQNVIPAKNLATLSKAPEKIGATAQLVSQISIASSSTTMTPDQKNFQIAQSIITAASVVDPTGIMSIVSSYTQPNCSLVGPPQ